MAVVSSSSMSFASTSPFHLPRIELKSSNLPCLRFFVQAVSNSQNGGNGRRRVWRRRELQRKDPTLKYRTERTPFLEERVRKIREGGELVGFDIQRQLLSEENRFDFVNQVTAEARRLLQNNPGEFLESEAVLRALSNRLNEAGIFRHDAYMEPEPYKPPGSVRYELD